MEHLSQLDNLSPWDHFLNQDSVIPFTSYQANIIAIKTETLDDETNEYLRGNLTDDEENIYSPLLTSNTEPLPEFPEYQSVSQSVSLDDLMTIEPFSPKKENQRNGEAKQDIFTFEIDPHDIETTSTGRPSVVQEQQQEVAAPTEATEPERTTKGRKRRVRFTPEEKKLRRREQNRIAAQRSRQRKRAVDTKTSSEFHELISSNSQLQQEIEILRKEKEQLEQMLYDHLHVCPLTGSSLC